MKKSFVLGMVVLSMSAAQVSFAAGVARAPREVLMDYTRQVKESMLGKGGSTKNMSDAAMKQAKVNIVKELNLSGKEANLNIALTGEAAKTRMESLVTIIAVKKASDNLAKADAAEAQSMTAAADASAKLIANSILIGAVKDSAIPMKAEELSLVRDSLAKLEKMPGDIILQFSKTERDSYTQILEKLDTLAETSGAAKKSYEESFIDAIMSVKNVDRAKALEIVKKLKECV